jgi:hypothetical protein
MMPIYFTPTYMQELEVMLCKMNGNLLQSSEQLAQYFSVRYTYTYTNTCDFHKISESVLQISFTLKNPSSSARLEPANLGSKGKHTNH